MKSILLILSIAILGSCSSSWHLRKAIAKDPTIIQQDTITVIDTIRTHTNRVSADTVFRVSSDTTIIIKDNLTIRHFIHNDSVFIEGVCDSIFVEIPIEIEIPVDRIIYRDKFPWYYFVIGAMLIAMILLFVRYKFFNQRRIN